MLRVNDHYKCFNYFNAGTDFICQNEAYKDGPHVERVKWRLLIENQKYPIRFEWQKVMCRGVQPVAFHICGEFPDGYAIH